MVALFDGPSPSSGTTSFLSSRRLIVPAGGLFLLAILLFSASSSEQVSTHASAAGKKLLSYYGPASAAQGGAASGPVLALGPTNLQAAVAKSEAIWQRNLDKRNAFIEKRGGLDKMTMFEYDPAKPHATDGAQMWVVWDLFTPAYNCPWEVERIGATADGGKYVCGLERIVSKRQDRCIVYSFGVWTESSFEAEMLERSECEVWMFDFSVNKPGPEVRALPKPLLERAHFFPYGIGARNFIQGDNHDRFYTLRRLMEMNGHDHIDILKVDVEGAEFEVLDQIIDDFGPGKLPFDQMQLELHIEQTKPHDTTADLHEWWTSLEAAGLRAFSSELNYPSIHWLPHPTAMEMNWINTCNGAKECGALVRD